MIEELKMTETPSLSAGYMYNDHDGPEG